MEQEIEALFIQWYVNEYFVNNLDRGTYLYANDLINTEDRQWVCFLAAYNIGWSDCDDAWQID